jgi:hypothetical protein
MNVTVTNANNLRVIEEKQLGSSNEHALHLLTGSLLWEILWQGGFMPRLVKR